MSVEDICKALRIKHPDIVRIVFDFETDDVNIIVLRTNHLVILERLEFEDGTETRLLLDRLVNDHCVVADAR